MVSLQHVFNIVKGYFKCRNQTKLQLKSETKTSHGTQTVLSGGIVLCSSHSSTVKAWVCRICRSLSYVLSGRTDFLQQILQKLQLTLQTYVIYTCISIMTSMPMFPSYIAENALSYNPQDFTQWRRNQQQLIKSHHKPIIALKSKTQYASVSSIFSLQVCIKIWRIISPTSLYKRTSCFNLKLLSGLP